MPAARPRKPVSSTSVSSSFTLHFPSHTFSDNKGEPRWGPLTNPPTHLPYPTHPPSPRRQQQGLINVSRREGSVRHLTVIRTRPWRTRADRRRHHSSPILNPTTPPTTAAHLHMQLNPNMPPTRLWMEAHRRRQSCRGGGRVSGGQCRLGLGGGVQGPTVLASHMSMRVKAERVQLKNHHAVGGSSAGNYATTTKNVSTLDVK